MKFEIKKISLLVFQLSLLLILASCNNKDDTIITDVEEEEGLIPLTDSWICEMQSFEEEDWNYEIYLESNGDYVAVSDSRILKVSKDGILNSIIMLTYQMMIMM